MSLYVGKSRAAEIKLWMASHHRCCCSRWCCTKECRRCEVRRTQDETQQAQVHYGLQIRRAVHRISGDQQSFGSGGFCPLN